MSSGDKIHPSKMVDHLTRYLKCKELPDHDRRQVQAHILKLLFILRPEEEQNKNAVELMNFLGNMGPRQVCQYQFKSNDIVWICKECQTDETCVICNECYQASDHEGHDVYFYHSVSGGCCDCGDGEAWCSKGFCDKHGKRTADPVSYIPREIAGAADRVFDTIAESLLAYAQYIDTLYDTARPRRERAGDLCTMTLVADEYHTNEELSALLRLADHPVSLAAFLSGGSAVLMTGSFGECAAMATELQMRGFNALVGYVSDAAVESRLVAAVSFMHELARRNDGLCRLICSILDDDLLCKLLSYHPQLPKELGRAIYDLLLVLMAEQSFKIVIAVAYSAAYPAIARHYARGLSASASSVYALSVQFLNRESFVNDVSFKHAFLSTNVAALNGMLRQAQELTKHEATAVTSNPLSAEMTKALRHNILIKRRYNPIIGDLKVVFTNHRIARYFLSCCQEGFLTLLESYQYLHPQQRALHAHVEYEDNDWMAAFNLNLGVTGVFDSVFNWFADADASCVLQVRYRGFDSHPHAFDIVACREDGWLPSDPSAVTMTTEKDSGGVDRATGTLSSGFGRYMNSSNKTATDSATAADASSATMDAQPSSAAPGHTLPSVWSVLHQLALRCFAWEKRFQSTLGIGVTLPPRSRGRKYAQYGESYGEDVQLIDLIHDYAQRGIGKLPRMVSFHLPLHRTLAYAIGEACKHQHLAVCIRSLQVFMAEQARVGTVSLSGSVDVPLCTVVTAAQIGLRMWQRNGQSMIDQVLNYDSYPFCRIYKELDTLLIQFLLTVHPSDQLVSQLFYRFGVAEYLAHRKSEAIGAVASNDSSYLPALLDEALRYVVILATELPVPSITPAGSAAPVSLVRSESAAMLDGVAGVTLESASTTKVGGVSSPSTPPAPTPEEARMLPLIRREFLHKLIGGAVTYSQLQECFAMYPESSNVSTELIDAIVSELTVKHDSALGPPTYTLKKEKWAEYDPCFPRVPAGVHQRAFEDRPKVFATAPIITKPAIAHECFAAVRGTMLLAPVLLRVQRDLLYVAAAERCTKKEVYQVVRDKWTIKCNDAIYGKVLQLLTLAVYATQDLKEEHALAASALEIFVLEECFLPSSETAFDIYYANDPLDASSKHWVLWLVEQLAALSAMCSDSIASYRASNTPGHIASSSSSHHSSTTAAAEAMEETLVQTAPGAAESKALSARDKAMQAMKEKAAQFALMMEGMSDTDSEDEEGGGKQEQAAAGMETAHQGMKSSSSVVAAEMRGDTKETSTAPTAPQSGSKFGSDSETAMKAGGAETTAMEVSSASEASPVKGSGDSPLPASDDDVPVCIVCQADANAEDTTGNLRVLGYLALVQASTVLQRAAVDGKTEMHVLDTVPMINSKVAPRRPAMEGNAHLSFCGHCMHQDCFQTYLASQLRKAAEQSEMVLDQTKHQFCCPLCKKLGNLFVPSVETDALQMETREGIRMKLATALRKKQTQHGDADSSSAPNTTTSTVAYRPDMTEMPKPWVAVLPTPAQRVAQTPKLQDPIAQHCWSWLSWIRHPSLVNSDLGVFYKYANASNAPVVSFEGLDGEDGHPLKRARSQTSDSADLGRMTSKMNTSPEAPPFPPLPAEADLKQTANVSMGESVDSDEDGGGANTDFVPFITAADAMSYSLNDIDLNSVSTERRVQASVALEEELRGITIEAAPSLDDWDDEYQSLLDAGFGSHEAPDPVRDLELHRRKEEKILEAIRSHSTEHVMCDYVKRRAWGIFLEDITSAVYTDLGERGSHALGARIHQSALASYVVIVPQLQAVLRCIAYTASCDAAEHNLPGYHLLKEQDLTTPVPGSQLLPDSAQAPLSYVMKYSLGMDDCRYLDKAVDAVACTLHTYSCLDAVDQSLSQMLAGTAHRSTPTAASLRPDSSTWLPMPAADGFFSAKTPIVVAATPLLACPLLDVMVLSLAVAKGAPAGHPESLHRHASPRSSRNPLHGVQYHPVWNAEHAYRWICVAKLAQLLVAHIDAQHEPTVDRADTSSTVSDAFSSWPSVAGFIQTMFEKLFSQYSTANAGRSAPRVLSVACWCSSAATEVMAQWLSFLRTSAHLLYRTCCLLHSASSAALCPPQAWLAQDLAPALVQQAAEVTDQQVRKHLTLLSMPELLAGDIIDSTGHSVLVEATVCWLSDVIAWSSIRAESEHAAVDPGVSTTSEVTTVLEEAENNALWGLLAPARKPPGGLPPTEADGATHYLLPAQLRTAVFTCYPRLSRAQLIALPNEYTKLHALVMSKIAAHRAIAGAIVPDVVSGAPEEKVGEFEHPALCLLCAAVIDAGGRGQCAAHTMQCGGEACIFFLLQECQVLLNHGPRGIYYASPYIDSYGESQHHFRGKPLHLDARRYEALTRLHSAHQLPKEVVSKRSSATRIIINNYY